MVHAEEHRGQYEGEYYDSRLGVWLDRLLSEVARGIVRLENRV